MSVNGERTPSVLVANKVIAGSLLGIRPNDIHSLLVASLPEIGVESVSTSAVIKERPETFDVLSITSAVDLVVAPDYHRTADRFTKNIVQANDGLATKRLLKGLALGVICVLDDTELDDHYGMVVPLYAGRTWFLQSILEHFLDVSDSNENMSRVLQAHSIMLNALFAAIQDRDYPGVMPLNQRPLRLTLKSPEQKQMADEPLEAMSEHDDNFAAFVGIDSVIRELRGVVKLASIDNEKLRAADVKPIQSIMFSGPSGTGKTELARSLADALGADLCEIDFREVGSKWTGEWATNISTIFSEAREYDGRRLIFFNEGDGLIVSGNDGTYRNIMAVLKTELESLHRSPNVYVVFATNDESAFPSELRVKKRMHLTLRLAKPTDSEKEAIFRRLLITKPLAALSLDSLGDDQELQDIALSRLSATFDFTQLIAESNDLTAGDIVEAINIIKQRRLIDGNGELECLQRPFTQEEVVWSLRELRRTREA